MAIHDTLIHEIDVFRWLLDDDYVSAQVIFPRGTSHAHAKLKDPQVVLLETAKTQPQDQPLIRLGFLSWSLGIAPFLGALVGYHLKWTCLKIFLPNVIGMARRGQLPI